MIKHRVVVFLLLTFVILAGCTPTSSPPTPSVSPLMTTSPLVSPLPSLLEGEVSSAPVFKIDEPVYVGDKRVTGTGPAGVPIKLVDVSEIGAELARTEINKDGTFVFRLSEGLPDGHSIGLQIGNLSGTEFEYEDFERGETYYDRPLVGILLDMVSVREPSE